jgi:UDP-glucose 4-epimerase
MEVVRAFEHASNRKVEFQFAPRRPGDVAVCYADPAHAEALLGWKATRDLREMCSDMWHWQVKNPNGYVE